MPQSNNLFFQHTVHETSTLSYKLHLSPAELIVSKKMSGKTAGAQVNKSDLDFQSFVEGFQVTILQHSYCKLGGNFWEIQLAHDISKSE